MVKAHHSALPTNPDLEQLFVFWIYINYIPGYVILFVSLVNIAFGSDLICHEDFMKDPKLETMKDYKDGWGSDFDAFWINRRRLLNCQECSKNDCIPNDLLWINLEGTEMVELSTSIPKRIKRFLRVYFTAI